MADSGEIKFILGRENLVIKKFIIGIIVCLSLCMISCGKGEEKAERVACIPEKLRENIVEMDKGLINRDHISKILDETITSINVFK